MEFERIADKKRLDFIIEAVGRAVRPDGLILDVGCGNGIISSGLGAQGYEVTGIDSSEKAIEVARARNTLNNVNFSVISAEELAAGDHRYDAMICSEVLEHLADPGSLLRTLKTLLNPGGILVVTVPNGRGPRELFVTRPVQYLQQKDNLVWKLISKLKHAMGYTGTTVQSSADDLTHIQFFTKNGLNRLAADNGFSITSFSSTNFIEQVFPFSLLAKRSQLLQKMDYTVAGWLPHGFSSGFMTVWKKAGD